MTQMVELSKEKEQHAKISFPKQTSGKRNKKQMWKVQKMGMMGDTRRKWQEGDGNLAWARGQNRKN
jgi:hypothetical protein